METMNIEPTRNESDDSIQYACGYLPSRTMKITFTGILILIIVIAIVTPIIFHVSLSSNDSKENAIIPDSELQNLAAYYTESLDQNSPPCEDFYAFACGNLRRKYEKENENHFDTISMMEKRTRVLLDDFLTKPLNASDSATLKQMKIFQQLCINKTKVETEGINSVLTLLNEIGGWPLLTNGSENNESWEQIVGSVNRAGFATIFPFHLTYSGATNSSAMLAYKLAPLLDSKVPRLLPNEKRTTDYVKRVASLLNATNHQLDDDIRNCIDFESELQELTNFVVEDDKKHTLESLRTDYPGIAWETFFRNVFVSTGLYLSSNETVFLPHPKYNVKVFELLNKTSAKIVRNYVVWRLIVEAIPLMPEKFREAKNVFEQRTVGQSRNLDCLDVLINNAEVSIGYLYIKNLLDGQAKSKCHGMLKNIKSQAYQFLRNISWMENYMKLKLIIILSNSKMMVPHPEDDIYVMETLEFQSNDTIFANYRRLAEAHRDFEYGKLRMSPEFYQQSILFRFATTADAWYSPSMNTLFMLPAIFQRPLFSASQPMYLNYGSIGFTMAHKVMHGLKFLSACNIEKCPSFDRFQERKDCMEKLYSGYVLKQLNETGDGKSTMEENIGDLIGLKLSYSAYEKFAKNSEEQLLPGLNYTARQWFWINAATFFCSYESDVALRNHIKYNRHSPDEARVNVGFANTDEFSRDFKCPIGSRMNPVRKCGFQ